jgi:hypothetical protein
MMDDLTSRQEQLDWVMRGDDESLTDEQLSQSWEDAYQWRDWISVEFISAEQEYRQAQKQLGLSRQDWYRIEMEKLDRRP